MTKKQKKQNVKTLKTFRTLKYTFVTFYYILISFLIISCIHLSEHYHYHLKHSLLVVSFFWVVTELLYYTERSKYYTYELITWLFWLNYVISLNTMYANPQKTESNFSDTKIEWIHDISSIILIGISLKSGVEYYISGRSSNTILYCIIYFCVLFVFPRINPPHIDNSILLPFLSSMYFIIVSISSNCITKELIFGKDQNNLIATRSMDNVISKWLNISRVIQCSWVLFVWRWYFVLPCIIVQVLLYMKIYQKYTIKLNK